MPSHSLVTVVADVPVVADELLDVPVEVVINSRPCLATAVGMAALGGPE